ncbi:unnamed protein product [Brassicogethes aeneus]|uniref:Uncharacterized protein n=1 Tax=Brassicogethes aeneus TaxID=1431903 RepID=A0A9P0AVY3_BRAAE|nr:unnamed protein product [Brassicogethes aeneus]
MYTLVPEKALDNLVCFECFKYVSVKPVKLYINKAMRCGRCVKETDGGVESKVNLLYGNMLFKCHNRYEGCTKLLLPSQVQDHEKICRSEAYFCPLCPNSKMPPFFMLEHFKHQHRRSFLEKPSASVDIGRETNNYYLYRH